MKWGVRKNAYKYAIKDGELTIKKGSEIRRVTRSADQENHTGHLYGSFTKEDIAHYQKTVPKYMSVSGSKTYDMTLKVTKDLVSPSMQKRVDTVMTLINNDKDLKMFIPEIASEYLNRSNFKNDYDMAKFKELSSKYQKIGYSKDTAQAYSAFILESSWNKEYRDLYFGELSKKGYNMVIDDEDQLSNEAIAPIIVFDRGDTLTVSKLTVNRGQ